MSKTQKYDIEQTTIAANHVSKAGSDGLKDLGARDEKVFANLSNCAEALELHRSAVEIYLAKDVVNLHASPSYLLRKYKE